MEIVQTKKISEDVDLSLVDRKSLLSEIEEIQKEIKERQDVVIEKAKLLEKTIDWVAQRKVDTLKDIDYTNFTNEDWEWIMSEGQIDDRSGIKHEFKKSILFGKFGFIIEKFWKFTNQSCLVIGKVFFKVPDKFAEDRIKDICKHYKTLNSFHDQENVHIFQIQDKQNGKAGVYYFEYNQSNNTGRITKIYHNATTEPKPWKPILEILADVEKIS